MFCALIRRAADIYGSFIAVADDTDALTYAEVYERSCRLANALAAAGAVPGEVVASLGRNRIESFEEIAGVALGGFVRSPLYGQDTPERQHYMLHRAGAAALLVDADRWTALRPLVAADPGPLRAVLVRDDDAPSGPGATGYHPALDAAPADDPDRRIDPDSPYVIRFSAGSTGLPKPVAHSVRGYHAAGMELVGALPPFRAQDAYLAVSPYSHASANFFWPFVAAGARHLIPVRFDAGTTLAAIRAGEVTVLYLVPATAQQLVDHPAAGTTDFSGLHVAVYGAAPFPERLVRRLYEVLGPRIWNVYGQAELPVATILGPADHRAAIEDGGPQLRSSGRPAPNAEIRIVDGDGRTLRPGEMGEIALRSPAVMTGIPGDPEATRSRIDDEGWLHTRDVGRIEEGHLYLTDRLDDVIISGGYNIWPAEVENALAAHPSVAQAVAFGIPSVRWGESPAGVVTLRPGAAATVDELLAWSRQQVGGVKKPVAVLVVEEELPTNTSGKVVRRQARERWSAALVAQAQGEVVPAGGEVVRL